MVSFVLLLYRRVSLRRRRARSRRSRKWTFHSASRISISSCPTCPLSAISPTSSHSNNQCVHFCVCLIYRPFLVWWRIGSNCTKPHFFVTAPNDSLCYKGEGNEKVLGSVMIARGWSVKGWQYVIRFLNCVLRGKYFVYAC